jgi:hypothetical protein
MADVADPLKKRIGLMMTAGNSVYGLQQAGASV